ncbi:MAG: beta-propeller domain-containing protein [Clostridia bacterium]|nr:beta-propeller domain-containing protein [Clostridia bacterium]
MFEDKYKKEMENVKLSDTTKINPQELIKTAKASKKAAYRRWISLAAACLLIFAGIAAFFPASKLLGNVFSEESKNGGNLLEGIIPPGYSQDVSDTEKTDDVSSEAEKSDITYLLSNQDAYDKTAEMLLDYFGNNENKYGNAWGSTDEGSGNDSTHIGDGVYKDVVCGAYHRNPSADFFDSGTDNTAVEFKKIVHDDNFIYVLNNLFNGNFITVYSVSNGKIVHSSKTDLPTEDLEYGKYEGIFVHGDRLYVLSRYSKLLHTGCKDATYIHIYDVTKNCTLEDREVFVQTGYCNSIQLNEDKLYITTTYSIPREPQYIFENCDENEAYENKPQEITKDDVMAALPVSGINGGKTVAPENIYLPEEIKSPSVFVVTGFDLQTFECNTACVIDDTTQIYGAGGNVFKIKGMYKSQYGYCIYIDRFTFEDCIPVYTGGARVSGQYFNDKSFDLYENNLRIALVKDEKLGFMVLDENLSYKDSIYRDISYTNIPAVRFSENSAGYVEVNTFNKVLFAVDFSSSQAIKNVSEGTGEGMLTYFKSFGKDMIFGYGNIFSPEDGKFNLTITIYDCSDPLNITKKNNYDLGERRNPVWQIYYVTDTMVFNDTYDRITVTYSENIVLGEAKFKSVYCIEAFRYDGNELVSIGKFQQEEIQIDANTFYVPTLNSVIIGDYIYIVMEINGVPSLYSYSASDFTLIDSLE